MCGGLVRWEGLRPDVYQFASIVGGSCGTVGTGLGDSFDGKFRSGREIEAFQGVVDRDVRDFVLAVLAGKTPIRHLNLALVNSLSSPTLT